MSKKTNQHLLYAVVTTVLACMIIFGSAWYIFTPDNMTPSSEVIHYQSGSTVIVSRIHVDTGATTIKTSQVQEPRACMMNYAPVCGVDGQTYSNDCTAGDVAISHIGECETDKKRVEPIDMPQTTGTIDPGYETDMGEYTDTDKYLVYTNTSLGYTFSLPRYAHYQGMGARDGASHSVAIAMTATGTDTWDGTDVQVWYYRKAPTNPPAATVVTLPTGVVYIKQKTITANPKIDQIVDVIQRSVR